MRLDGWKSIAAHFGRERSTVIRWASERGLPVHRIPGKGRGSVFAITEELDAWLAQGHGLDTVTETASPPEPAIVPGKQVPDRPGRLRWLVPAAVAISLGVGALAWRSPEPAENAVTVPADPAAARMYLEARAEWAERTPGSLDNAVAKLRQVIAIDPGFAPAYAALADTYILAREFGSLPDLEAFARAQAAIDAGMRVDRNQPDLLRAKGFLDYWWRGDRLAAAESFEAALARAPEAAQTHFWYGNVLVDNGDFSEGLAHFDRARLLDPGSTAIQADLAWALWSAGQDQAGRDWLARIATRNPDLAVVPDYQSVMSLAEGDWADFVGHVERMAAIRQEPSLTAHAAQLRTELDAGEAALVAFMVRDALAEAETGERKTLAWPAFVASCAGDRGKLVAILDRAIARREAWGSAGLRDHIARSWRGDPAISARLGQLKASPMAAGSDKKQRNATSNN